jgi:hypothetical protein
MPKLPLGTEGLARPAADLMPQSHRSLNTQPGEVRLDKEGAPTSHGSERPQNLMEMEIRCPNACRADIV